MTRHRLPAGPAQRYSPSVVGPNPRVAVIIVNYGTADLTGDAVDSVLCQARMSIDVPLAAVEVHVLDNASPPADQARLAHMSQRWPPQVHVRQEPRNHGFGGGVNIVLTSILSQPNPPELVFLLNPDARLETDVLGQLSTILRDQPCAAFAGAGICRPGAGPVTAAFRFPSILSAFCSAAKLGIVDRICARWRVPLAPDITGQTVDWVAGAAVMVRVSALREIGLFDPGYFLYFEEVDLMRRAARAGWTTWYVPTARVAHHEGAATGIASHATQQPRRPSYWYASWHRYHTKALGRLGATLAAFAALSGTLANTGVARLRGQTPDAPAHFIDDFCAMALRPLFGLKARPYD